MRVLIGTLIHIRNESVDSAVDSDCYYDFGTVLKQQINNSTRQSAFGIASELE